METFRAINTSYYRQANCCLLVYDITDQTTFDDCKKYYKEKINEFCYKKIPIILLGNKTDKEEDRKVPSEEGAKFASENNYIFMETSCLKNKNVADAFETLIEITNREQLKEKEQGIYRESSVVIDKNHIKKRKKKCHC